MSHSERSQDPPFIFRLAGLSFDRVVGLSNSVCADLLAERHNLEQEASQLRSQFVDRLHLAIHEAPPELRRFFLVLKRDGFNGRRISRHLNAPEWTKLVQVAGEALEGTLRLENRLEDWQSRFEEVFTHEQERQRKELFILLSDSQLRRGIALASPELLRESDRMKRSLPRAGRKERRLEESLLRYICRAAFKLSPFSTLTRVGLGTVEDGNPQAACQLLGTNWHEFSLVRLKRYRFNQISALVLRHPRFRMHLQVELNDTVELISPGQYRFLRPGWYGTDATRLRFRYFNESLVKVSLGGPLIAWLLEKLPGRDRTFEQLQTELQKTFSSTRESIEGILVKLLDVGILHLLPPWSSNDPCLEWQLAAALRPFSDDPDLGKLLTLPSNCFRSLIFMLKLPILFQLLTGSTKAPPVPGKKHGIWPPSALRSYPMAQRREILTRMFFSTLPIGLPFSAYRRTQLDSWRSVLHLLYGSPISTIFGTISVMHLRPFSQQAAQESAKSCLPRHSIFFNL